METAFQEPKPWEDPRNWHVVHSPDLDRNWAYDVIYKYDNVSGWVAREMTKEGAERMMACARFCLGLPLKALQNMPAGMSFYLLAAPGYLSTADVTAKVANLLAMLDNNQRVLKESEEAQAKFEYEQKFPKPSGN